MPLRRSKVWNNKGKPKVPMNRSGKGSRRTSKSNATNKKRFLKEGIDCCQLCGRNESLSNSHSVKEDRRDVTAKTALLCIWPCHQFLELNCSSPEREAVNRFLIETDLEGEDKFNRAMTLLPAEKGAKLLQRLHNN